MVFGREWRLRPAAGSSPRAGPRAASGSPRDRFCSSIKFLAAKLETLKSRRDFLRIAARGRKAMVPGLVLQAAPRPESCSQAAVVRVGFTASRRVGGSVVRNRAKRRLRAAAAEVLPHQGRSEIDYVLIARAATAERPYAALVADLQSALRRIATKQGSTRSAAAVMFRARG
jgi:ribonuclease P protein component